MKLAWEEFDSASLSGEWKDDIKIPGVMYLKDGTRYEGPLIHNRPHGKGVLIDKDRAVLSDFKDGEKNGLGTVIVDYDVIKNSSWYKMQNYFDDQEGISKYPFR